MKLRMVDRIQSWNPLWGIRGTKVVSFEEYCLKEAFGDQGRLPESLLLQSFYELAAWWLILVTNFTHTGIPKRVRAVQFQDSLGPGGGLTMELRLRRRTEGFAAFDGTGEGKGVSFATVTGLLLTVVPLEEYMDPSDLRILYSEIGE